MIAPDLLGFGRSDKPNNFVAYTIDRHVSRLSALWQSLNTQEVSLVVHDWGGPIGFWWLKESRTPLRRLVVFNTFSPVLPGKQGQTAALNMARITSRFRPLADLMYRRRHLMLRNCLFGAGMLNHMALTAEVRAAYWAPHLRAEDRTGVLAFPLQIPRMASEPVAQRSAAVARELKDALNAIPTFLLWGTRDYLFDETTLSSWINFLPRAKVVRMEHASHYVLEDVPELAASAIAHALL